MGDELDKKLRKEIFRADSLLREQKPLEAVLALKETLREFSDSGYVYYLLGVARMKCGLFCLAKKSFKKADELDPQNPENIKNLGWAKIMLGEIEEGRDDLRNAINLDLTNSLIYLDLAKSFFDQLNFDEGFAWIDRAKNLDPNNKFIMDNYKFAKEMKEDFYKLSEAQREEIKKDKLVPEMQQQAHLSIIKQAFASRGFKEEEMEELKEELDLSGLANKMLIYKDNVAKNETRESARAKQKKIEESLLVLIKESKSNLTIDKIKEIIYNEKGRDELDEIMKKFDSDQELEELNKILQLLNDAWNYFPHKCLEGLSPIEMLLTESKNKK